MAARGPCSLRTLLSKHFQNLLSHIHGGPPSTLSDLSAPTSASPSLYHTFRALSLSSSPAHTPLPPSSSRHPFPAALNVTSSSNFGSFRGAIAVPCRGISTVQEDEYGHGGAEDGAQFGIAPVPFDKEKLNKVFLTGILGRDFELRMTNSNTSVATSRLVVRKVMSAEAEDGDWFTLEAWDGLAVKFSRHLRKGMRVVVEGRIKLQSFTGRDGLARTDVKVVVKSVNPLESLFPKDESSYQFSHSHVNSSNRSQPSSVTETESSSPFESKTATLERVWRDFFANPSEWYDNRNNEKRNPNAPDFTRKAPMQRGAHTVEVLWLENRFKPAWVDRALQDMYRPRKPPRKGPGEEGEEEEGLP